MCPSIYQQGQLPHERQRSASVPRAQLTGVTLLDGLLEALEVLASHAQTRLEDVGSNPVGAVGKEERHCADGE